MNSFRGGFYKEGVDNGAEAKTETKFESDEQCLVITRVPTYDREDYDCLDKLPPKKTGTTQP